MMTIQIKKTQFDDIYCNSYIYTLYRQECKILINNLVKN